MPKNYTATDINKIVITYNLRVFKEDTELYYAALMRARGYAVNGSMIVPVKNIPVWIGTGQATPWTKQQLWAGINGYSSMNTVAADAIKQLFIDGIDEDPST